MFEWLYPTFGKCIFCNEMDLNSKNFGICSECQKDFTFSSRDDAVFVYDKKAKFLIQNLKYDNKRYIAKILAKYAKEKIDKFDYDIITFVPMYYKKQFKRRYNQGKLLCKYIDKPKTQQLLIKTKDTQSQTTLSFEHRRINLIGAFALKENIDIENKTILIIDDVKTTGSTLNECIMALKKGKPKKIITFTICITD